MRTELVEMLVRHEGEELKPYKCPADKWTIGVGRNIEDNGISISESRNMLLNDIFTHTNELRRFHWFDSLSSVRQVALIDMHFNLGHTRFCKFKKMIKALEEDDYIQAADEMLDSSAARKLVNRYTELAYMMRNNDYYRR